MGALDYGNPSGRPSGMLAKSGDKDSSDLKTMRERFEMVLTNDQENRDNYIKDIKISCSADMWDAEVKQRRGINRPALTFNLLNLVVKQIIGDYRQNKMNIEVLPAGGAATEDVADILGGMIRNIEMDSKADQAYTNALELAARGNIGWIRVVTEYEADDVFNQKLVIKPVSNSLTVYCDPNARRVTREDANWMIITEMVSKEEFRRQYPNAEAEGWDLVDTGDDDNWGDDDNIRIAEYYTKETVTERLVAFSNGSVIAIDSDDEIEALAQVGITPVKERQAQRTNIKWRKCTGSHILEERTYKAKYIPVIACLGEEVNIEGKPMLRSAIYYGIDANLSYNYERSASIERSALAAKAPWLVTQKQIELYRDQWNYANVTPQPYLVHTPDQAMPNGPQRIEPPSPSQADALNSQSAAQDVQRTTGVFDSQLGQKTNVQSGVGLQEQQAQGVTSTFIFTDNLRSCIEQCGRVCIDWAPITYDTDQVVRVINAEGDIDMQRINQQQNNPMLGVVEVLNDITVGKYDVNVTAGKAFASRRAEANDAMLKWAQIFPQQGMLISDKILENMDVQGGDVMAARVKRSLPPQVVNDPDSPEGQQAMQQAQAQQQQQQQIQQQMLQQHMAAQQGKIQGEMAKSQATVVKAQAEVAKAHSDVQVAQIQAQNAKVDAVGKVLDHDRQPEAAQTASNSGQGSARAKPPVVFKSREDYANEDEDMQNSREIKEMLGHVVQHLTNGGTGTDNQKTQDVLAQIAAQHHQLGQHIVQGHQAIAQHMAQANKIAAAPSEPIRDPKTNKVIGARKVLK